MSVMPDWSSLPDKLSVPTFGFFAGIGLSYATHISWWTIAGLSFYFVNKSKNWVSDLALLLFVVSFVFGIIKTGWAF